MNGVRTDPQRQRDELVDIEITLSRGRRAEQVGLGGHANVLSIAVRLGIHRDARYAQALGGARNAANNLAPIGDEQSSYHDAHIRNMPKRVAALACVRVSASAKPKTRRVSQGSITPSSQSRAEA